MMDGKRQRFSGVVSASYLTHPSILAQKLQNRSSRVLTHPGVELLARELQLPVDSNLTEKRSKKWIKQGNKYGYGFEGGDTVGCVIRSNSGVVIAAASTGGKGFEYPGRMSDTATVAGNYASAFAAITATGVGEQIVDDAVAARMETRIRDGNTLHEASRKGFKEAKRRKRRYGWLAVDPVRRWGVAHTTSTMPFVVMRPGKLICSTFKDLL